MHSSMNDVSAERYVSRSPRRRHSASVPASLTMVGEDLGNITPFRSSRALSGEGSAVRTSTLDSRRRGVPSLELVRSRPAPRREPATVSFLRRILPLIGKIRLPKVRIPSIHLPRLLFRRPAPSVAGSPGSISWQPRVRSSRFRLPDARLPLCDLSVAMALPVALVLIYLLSTGPLATLDLVTRSRGVALSSADPTELMLVETVGGTVQATDPVNLDARQFEQIRSTEYVVREGDTISEIAFDHGLNVGTLLSVNPGHDVRRLFPGTVLTIPDRDGVLYAIGPGDTLLGIAGTYDITVEAILDANGLESTVLEIGESLFLPGAEMEPTQYLLAIGELFHWPTQGRFTSGYGGRIHPITGIWHMHTGIDLANTIGTRVNAARSGRVVYVDESSAAYGRMVIIDHGLGFRTLYGHLNSFVVRTGQYVETGQMIGRMGNTGRSTGSHLHFSVIRNGLWEDPLDHLP